MTDQDNDETIEPIKIPEDPPSEKFIETFSIVKQKEESQPERPKNDE